MAEASIRYRQLDPLLIASIKAHVHSRAGILPLFERLRAACGDAVCGDAQAILHGGAVKDGLMVEAAYPVRHPLERGEVHTRMLEGARVLAAVHAGPHESIRDTVMSIYAHLEQHAWTTSLLRREIYQVIDPLEPANNRTEVQVVLHEWDRLFVQAVEKVFGTPAGAALAAGRESIGPEMSADSYRAWVQAAVARLDDFSRDEEKKCQALSHCAHVFPQERIEHLRAVCAAGGVDAVLHEMDLDPFWYEKPVRHGRIIRMRKNPHDPEAYERAVTAAERRRAYCHCPFVQPYLGQVPGQLSPTFCYCGSGWYSRLWEGILGQPVRIEHVETLLSGHEQCTLEITLPPDVGVGSDSREVQHG